MFSEIANDFGITPNFIEVSGRKLAYSELSPPDPKGTILLLNGLSAKRFGWYKQFAEFGKNYRTIAFDHRDVGDSDLADDDYTTADQADDAAAILKTLGVEKANLVGISMGGFVTLEIALRHPEIVERLVLVATSAGGKKAVKPKPAFVGKLLLDSIVHRKDAGKRAKAIYRRLTASVYNENNPAEMDFIAEAARHKPQSKEAYERQLRACQQHDARGRLSEIRVPTLVIHGENDPLVPSANGRFLAQNIMYARLIVYPNTGHIPILERADEFNRDVLAFLENDSEKQ